MRQARGPRAGYSTFVLDCQPPAVTSDRTLGKAGQERNREHRVVFLIFHDHKARIAVATRDLQLARHLAGAVERSGIV